MRQNASDHQSDDSADKRTEQIGAIFSWISVPAKPGPPPCGQHDPALHQIAIAEEDNDRVESGPFLSKLVNENDDRMIKSVHPILSLPKGGRHCKRSEFLTTLPLPLRLQSYVIRFQLRGRGRGRGRLVYRFSSE